MIAPRLAVMLADYWKRARMRQSCTRSASKFAGRHRIERHRFPPLGEAGDEPRGNNSVFLNEQRLAHQHFRPRFDAEHTRPGDRALEVLRPEHEHSAFQNIEVG